MQALLDIITRAGQLMLSYQQPRVYAKGAHADFVTEADLAVQAFLLEELSKAFPGAKFFAEEKDDNRLSDDLTFIIDPIDGTTNFFRHRSMSVVSVGAVEGGKPVFGAICDPYRGDLYHAVRGGGAYCNDQRLKVSDVPFGNAIVGLGSTPYHTDLAAINGRTFAELMVQCADVRRTGSAAMELCDVACGRSEACFEWILQPWDYCAGTLLVEEAGGRCGNILGGDVTYERGIPHMAANARCFDQLQALLQRIHRDLNT